MEQKQQIFICLVSHERQTYDGGYLHTHTLFLFEYGLL